jgi:hypothetical protein
VRSKLLHGEPSTATFWWVAKLCGGGDRDPAQQGDDRVLAGRRGSSVESYGLSALVGLAALGIVFDAAQSVIGGWAWLVFLPATFVGLQLLSIGWVGIGEILQRIGVLTVGSRVAFHGVGIGGSIAAAGLATMAPTAFPWLIFVLVEVVAWPVRMLWRLTEEEGI